MIGTARHGFTATMTFIGIVFAVSCATNPVSGKKELALVSESSEIEMGRQGAAEVTATIGLYPDVGLQAYVGGASKEHFSSKPIGADEFLTRIDGMVYGETPRAGYFRGTVFMHPDFEFLFQSPDGWKTQNASDAVSGVSPAQDAMIDLRAAKGSAADASKNFFGQATLQAGNLSQGAIHGNRSVSGEFTTQTDQGKSLHGIATFIEYGRGPWQITAYTETTRFAPYSAIFGRSIDSFDRLTDPFALAVQPMHLRVDKAPRAMTFEQFNAQLPSTISLAELAMINGLDDNAQLRAGQSIKRVMGVSVAHVSSAP